MANEEVIRQQTEGSGRVEPAESEADIRRQMEATRSSLSEKIGTLEQQVMDTVKGATSAVTGTVENVKESVQETVASVKDTVTGTVENMTDAFNLCRHMENHPWLNLGASIGIGYLLGNLLGPKVLPRPKARPKARRGAPPADAEMHFAAASPAERFALRGEATGPPPEHREPQPAKPTQPGWLAGIVQKLEPEINRVKGLALGTALGLFRDTVVRSVPEQMRTQVMDIFNSVTTKIGGERVEGVGDWASAQGNGPEQPTAAEAGRSTGSFQRRGPTGFE
jgi:ElaB/YqjD/DUF883 family membrane-anchored ribosome-binding protein